MLKDIMVMGPPNEKELELIKQLRENVRDLALCDEVLINANLIRWIRARNHSLKDAEEMFRNNIKWFDEVELGSIFEHEVPKAVSDAIVQPISGLDFIGNPIIVFPIGQMDFLKLMKEGHKESLMIHVMQLFERDAYFIRNLMAEQQKSDTMILYTGIFDMEGLSWGQLASKDVIQFMVTFLKSFEANYPETAYKLIVINAPSIFTFLWRIIRPFLSEATIGKVQLFGKNREQWQETLLQIAPKESLPEKYGGTLPDDVDILPKIPDCIPKKRGGY